MSFSLRMPQLLVIMLMECLLIVGCSKSDPILIGFVGSLTRFSTELNIQGRNGAVLAIEEINASGGIKGRPLSLTIRDIGAEPDSCERIIRELLASGHHYIIGPYTSNMANASTKAMKGKNALLLSPTMTTDALEGLDDEILRLEPSNFWQAEQLARHMKSLGIDSAITIYDASNREYSQTLVASFSATFLALGGKIQLADSIVSSSRTIHDIATKLLPIKSQGIFISTTGTQLATLAQSLRVGKNTTPLFSGAWGMTPEVLMQGGKNIEGTTFVTLVAPPGANPTAHHFETSFIDRFRTSPNFAASTSYEAVMALAQAFQNAPSDEPQKIKAYLLSELRFDGVSDSFRWNRFGDVMRKQSLVKIQNGKFHPLNE